MFDLSGQFQDQHPHPHPLPQLLLHPQLLPQLPPLRNPPPLPQKQESSRIQMIHSHPPPLPPPRNPPHPQLLPQLLPHPPEFPPQQHSSRRIQIQLPNPLPLPHPHPHPLLVEHPQESLHPQFVAVKSLMFLSLHRFIYALFYAGRHVNVSREKFYL